MSSAEEEAQITHDVDDLTPDVGQQEHLVHHEDPSQHPHPEHSEVVVHEVPAEEHMHHEHLQQHNPEDEYKYETHGDDHSHLQQQDHQYENVVVVDPQHATEEQLQHHHGAIEAAEAHMIQQHEAYQHMHHAAEGEHPHGEGQEVPMDDQHHVVGENTQLLLSESAAAAAHEQMSQEQHHHHHHPDPHGYHNAANMMTMMGNLPANMMPLSSMTSLLATSAAAPNFNAANYATASVHHLTDGSVDINNNNATVMMTEGSPSLTGASEEATVVGPDGKVIIPGVAKAPKKKRKRESICLKACVACQKAKCKCSNQRPCTRCQQHGIECQDIPQKKRGRKKKILNEIDIELFNSNGTKAAGKAGVTMLKVRPIMPNTALTNAATASGVVPTPGPTYSNVLIPNPNVAAAPQATAVDLKHYTNEVTNEQHHIDQTGGEQVGASPSLVSTSPSLEAPPQLASGYPIPPMQLKPANKLSPMSEPANEQKIHPLVAATHEDTSSAVEQAYATLMNAGNPAFAADASAGGADEHAHLNASNLSFTFNAPNTEHDEHNHHHQYHHHHDDGALQHDQLYQHEEQPQYHHEEEQHHPDADVQHIYHNEQVEQQVHHEHEHLPHEQDEQDEQQHQQQQPQDEQQQQYEHHHHQCHEAHEEEVPVVAAVEDHQEAIMMSGNNPTEEQITTAAQ